MSTPGKSHHAVTLSVARSRLDGTSSPLTHKEWWVSVSGRSIHILYPLSFDERESVGVVVAFGWRVKLVGLRNAAFARSVMSVGRDCVQCVE